MFTTLRNAWKIPELRKKIIFTLIVMLIYRLGNCVPVPYVNVVALNNYFTQQLANTVLGLYNAMSGSAFSQATVFALGIQPYINASIIIELLTIAIPALERLAKEDGEEGRKKIQNITRYTTIGLGVLMGFAYYVMPKNYSLLNKTGFVYGLVIVLTFTAGASFLMWMGEQINEFGIGNGISMILFAGIVSRIPQLVSTMVSSLANGSLKWYTDCRHPGNHDLHRVHHEFRAQNPRAVRKACRRSENVWWSVYASAHQGQYVRRPAYHLRTVHRFSARNDYCVHRHEQHRILGLDEQVRLR